MHLSYGNVVHSYRGGTGFMSSLIPRPSQNPQFHTKGLGTRLVYVYQVTLIGNGECSLN